MGAVTMYGLITRIILLIYLSIILTACVTKPTYTTINPEKYRLPKDFAIKGKPVVVLPVITPIPSDDSSITKDLAFSLASSIALNNWNVRPASLEELRSLEQKSIQQIKEENPRAIFAQIEIVQWGQKGSFLSKKTSMEMKVTLMEQSGTTLYCEKFQEELINQPSSAYTPKQTGFGAFGLGMSVPIGPSNPVVDTIAVGAFVADFIVRGVDEAKQKRNRMEIAALREQTDEVFSSTDRNLYEKAGVVFYLIANGIFEYQEKAATGLSL